MATKNPHTQPNGLPIPGKELAWAEHDRQEHQAYLDSLPPQERQAVERRQDAILRRMDSEQSVGVILG